MADNGINGWHYGSIANYYGKNLALPKCKDCHWLSQETGSIGSFGEYKYKCRASTGSAAAEFGQGRSVSDCKEYSKADEAKPRSRSRGGSKKPIWVRLLKGIICCPVCCIWNIFNRGQIDFGNAIKKGCEWCR